MTSRFRVATTLARKLEELGVRQIEEALALIKVQGDRYPPHLAARAGR